MEDAYTLVCSWYEQKMQKTLDALHQDAIRKMLQSGMTASMLMDCVDKAFLSCGFVTFAPDCWRAFYDESKQAYKDMKKRFPE